MSKIILFVLIACGAYLLFKRLAAPKLRGPAVGPDLSNDLNTIKNAAIHNMSEISKLKEEIEILRQDISSLKKHGTDIENRQ